MNRSLLTKILLALAVVIVVVITGFGQTPQPPKSYIGIGAGATRSTAEFGGTSPDIFLVGQKTLGDSRVRIKGLAEFKKRPLIPTLLQSDQEGARLDGWEFRARPEVEIRLGDARGIRPFVGFGLCYFHQMFQDEPFEYKAHYHHGINPIATIGTTIGKDDRHWVGVTRIFQEAKFRKFGFQEWENEERARLVNLQHKGTSNPAYLEGWRLGYNYRKPVSRNLSLYLGGEAAHYKYKECPIRKYGTTPGYCDFYYQIDNVFTVRAGIIFGKTR